MIKDAPAFFFDTFRITPSNFEHLLSLIGPKINKISRREPFPAAERIQMAFMVLLHNIELKQLNYDS